jgi:hypothetical protein
MFTGDDEPCRVISCVHTTEKWIIWQTPAGLAGGSGLVAPIREFLDPNVGWDTVHSD